MLGWVVMNGLGLKPDPYFPPKKNDVKRIALDGGYEGSPYVLVVARAILAIIDDLSRIFVLQGLQANPKILYNRKQAPI